MKIVYCGFDLFKDCLEGVLSAGHEILAIYSFPTDNKHDFHDHVLRLAEKNKIRFIVGPVREKDLHEFADMGCDLILSAGYAYKIPHCERIPYRLNIHPAPLPYGRGAWPIAGALLEGVNEWAVSIHELSLKWDEGAIVAQKKFPVTRDENQESLAVKCQMAARSLLDHVLSNLDTLWEKRVPQGRGVYWRMPTIAERTIDWSWPVEKIDRHVRSFGKHGSRALLMDQIISVQNVTVWSDVHGRKAGDIVWKTAKEIVVAAGDGLVCIRFWEVVTDINK